MPEARVKGAHIVGVNPFFGLQTDRQTMLKQKMSAYPASVIGAGVSGVFAHVPCCPIKISVLFYPFCVWIHVGDLRSHLKQLCLII